MFSLQTEDLGHSVHVDEVFEQKHIRNSSGYFVDHRSRRTHVSFFSTVFKFFFMHINYYCTDQVIGCDDVSCAC